MHVGCTYDLYFFVIITREDFLHNRKIQFTYKHHFECTKFYWLFFFHDCDFSKIGRIKKFFYSFWDNYVTIKVWKSDLYYSKFISVVTMINRLFQIQFTSQKYFTRAPITEWLTLPNWAILGSQLEPIKLNLSIKIFLWTLFV